MAVATITRRSTAPAGRPVERVLAADRLERLDVDVLGELLGAVDDRLEAVSSVDVRARLERGRARLELALSDRLAD